MDMHIPQALLQVAQTPRPYRVADRPGYFFSEQLSATYEATNHALWIRWTPAPRPSFNPEVLRSLDRCAQFIRANDGFIRAGDGFVPLADDTPEGKPQPMPIEYTVLCSGVPGVFNLGGDLDLFMRLIERSDRAGLVEYGTACIDVLYQNYCAHDLPITTISLVQGECLGGGFEAALSSDIVVAEKHVRFGFPEILFNLFPGMGAYSFLDRRVGRRVTEELLSTGKIYSADDMLAMGVIDRVADSGAGRSRGGGVDPAPEPQSQRAAWNRCGAPAREPGDVSGAARRGASVGRLRAAPEQPGSEADAAPGVATERHRRRAASCIERDEDSASSGPPGPLEAGGGRLRGPGPPRRRYRGECRNVGAAIGVHDPGGVGQTGCAGPEAAPLGRPGRAGGPAHRRRPPPLRLRDHRRAGADLARACQSDKYGDELAIARKSLREKRRIIQLLLDSETRYRDLVETSHDLIWTTDAQGRFTYLNNGAMDILGIPPKDLLGRCFFDFEASPRTSPTAASSPR